MEKLNWIKELVLAEQQMEEAGVVDMEAGFDPHKQVEEATVDFIGDLKAAFVETAAAFNQLKASTNGQVRIYGISKTKADFMLFRNGFKMVFSLKAPGQVSIRFNFIGPNTYIPSQIPTASQSSVTQLSEEHLLTAKAGPFGELIWSFQDSAVKLQNVVKHHLTMFIRESAK